MKKEYFIKEYNNCGYDNSEINELLKEYLIKSCLLVANKSNFSTDYYDVKDHIFEKDEYMKLFITENTKEVVPNIYGFAIFDSFKGYNDMLFLHCHGIVLGPEIQELGLSKKIINYAVKKVNPDILTVKTHNPRCFNSFINIDNVISYYPNELGIIPNEILELAKTDPFICQSNNDLIYKDAYPDEKIQQTKRNNGIDVIFNKLSPHDAQSAVIVLNDEKLKCKKLVKKI